MDLRLTSGTEGAWLDWGAGPRRAAIGPGGIAVKQSEGDGVTPRGAFPIREILYRADKGAPLKTGLPLCPIARDDGWCDAPADPNYNRLVKLPYPAGTEHLWRDDDLYDVIAVVGFNDDPVAPGRGSAIFLHLARPDFSPTAGCIALAREDLRAALEQLRPGDRLIVD
jgi:L,D-peptidoglycan transpeptidase YkuD (ErfK/YbiS/YcfS/YnhG family)